jgi:hypothetical protein
VERYGDYFLEMLKSARKEAKSHETILEYFLYHKLIPAEKSADEFATKYFRAVYNDLLGMSDRLEFYGEQIIKF